MLAQRMGPCPFAYIKTKFSTKETISTSYVTPNGPICDYIDATSILMSQVPIHLKPITGFAFVLLSSPYENMAFTLRKLEFKLGRGGDKHDEKVDVICDTKGISRVHLTITWCFQSNQFVAIVQGKNGALIDKQFYPASSPAVPLKHASSIGLGETRLLFLLPNGGADNIMAGSGSAY